MWKKPSYQIFAFMVILTIVAPTVMADWQSEANCRVGTPCTLMRLVTNETGQFEPILGASCNATIRNTTSLLFNNTPMTDLGTGYYNITFTPNNTGIYPSIMRCAYTGQIALADMTFTAAQQVSNFMGFELAIPAVFFGIALLCLWSFFRYEKNETIFDKTVKHACLVGMSLFLLVAIITLNYIVEYENVAGNAVLTRLSTLLSSIYVASLWITVAFIALIIIHFAISGIPLMKQEAMRAKDLVKAGPSMKFDKNQFDDDHFDKI